MIYVNQSCFLSVAFLEPSFLGSALGPPLSWQRQTQAQVGLASFSSLERLLQTCLPGSKRHPQNFRGFCRRTKGARFSLQHESFLPHKFPSFVLAKGDILSLLGLEDLQTDNSVQTALKNITLLGQPQG